MGYYSSKSKFTMELGWISLNPNITWDIIQANPDKPWNWYCISYNPSIAWDNIQANPDLPWNWYCISYNPNITPQIIKDNLDKPWDWQQLSFNWMNKSRPRVDKSRLTIGS